MKWLIAHAKTPSESLRMAWMIILPRYLRACLDPHAVERTIDEDE
jgi:hypothetical protein